MNKVYVLPNKNGWSVKQDENDKTGSTFSSKEEAIEAAKEIAVGREAELVILKADGTIDNLGAYSVDPFPSKEKGPEYNNDGDEGI